MPSRLFPNKYGRERGRGKEKERGGGGEEREREYHLVFLPTGPPAKLLFANRVDIRAIETSGRNYELLVKHLYNAIAVDYHYRSIE